MLERIDQHKVFGGQQLRYRHRSQCLSCEMTFSLFLPENKNNRPTPLVLWLSGLTCDDQNFSTKSGFQKMANQLGLAVAIPDTSPRGEHVADSSDWDLGQGAGFYLNASQEPWKRNYQMYDYISQELSQLVPVLVPEFNGKEAIMGHSMGGYGALLLGLKKPERFQSISAFAPITQASQVAWGQKAFSAYLGTDQTSWRDWDLVHLISQTKQSPPIKITQGLADDFYPKQLQADQFLEASHHLPLEYQLVEGYDHSYYMIASFIDEHLKFHASHLQ
ncbi:S-formylglutathione hydrolase [Vaginisenegalia massiliensis]|uniref:S-formylglutathione hydrolase n=1 Tax=Vaginisenegalia massiliensis TaxID=2058294 RepID=UPI000F51F45F|nr:S-formylglutathione hydrolase [Vaginisenegalia massiliensis]